MAKPVYGSPAVDSCAITAAQLIDAINNAGVANLDKKATATLRNAITRIQPDLERHATVTLPAKSAGGRKGAARRSAVRDVV